MVVTNLKPAKMRDVMSYGMVRCNQSSFLQTVFCIFSKDACILKHCRTAADDDS